MKKRSTKVNIGYSWSKGKNTCHKFAKISKTIFLFLLDSWLALVSKYLNDLNSNYYQN